MLKKITFLLAIAYIHRFFRIIFYSKYSMKDKISLATKSSSIEREKRKQLIVWLGL